jgi:hypothetical protein
VAPTIRYTNQQAAKRCIKSMVYGLAGVGKTRLCATAPKPMLISAESGTLSLRKLRVPYVEIHTVKDLVDVFNWARSSTETKSYDTFCLDSISEIADIVLIDEKRKNKDGRKAYYEMGEQMLALVRAFRDIQDKHVVIVAQQGRIRDEATGAIINGPQFPGQAVANKVPYFFDELWHMCVFKDADGKRIEALKTQADGDSDAKDRSGALDLWEQPNLTSIFTKILAN